MRKYKIILFLLLLNFESFSFDDSLFPINKPGNEQIKAGLKLTKKFATDSSENSKEISVNSVTCNACFETINFTIDEFYNKKTNLCIGLGSSKIALKINNSNKIILLGLDKELTQKEYQTYKILNAFGLISQQSPEIVTVFFNDQTIQNVLSVTSFEFLAEKGTYRKTWERKHSFGFGDIPIFNNNSKNFTDINYNYELLKPLVKDLCLWNLIGRPGFPGDSLNLIFKKQNNQTICRLLLYDFYDKYDEAKDLITYDNIYENVKYTRKNINKIWEKNSSHIKNLYTSFFPKIFSEEETKLWEEISKHTETTESLWKEVECFLQKEFEIETIRLIGLFESIFTELEEAPLVKGVSIQAKDRINFVKSLCEKNSNFDINTPVSELNNYLKKDLNFIRCEIESIEPINDRGSEHVQHIKNELFKVEKWVEENHKDQLTFLYYTAIGDFLSRVLSSKDITFADFMNTTDETKKAFSFGYNYEHFKKNGEVADYDFQYIYSKAIPMPYISKTGIIAEEDMNEGLSFFGENNSIHAIFFLGVGTNYELSYDEHINRNAFRFFNHDLYHGKMGGLIDYGGIFKMAQFRKEIRSRNLKYKEEFEKLFFNLFHEISMPLEMAFDDLKIDVQKLHRGESIIEGPLTSTDEDTREEFTEIAKEIFNW
jgi:hypothetical protein